MHIMYHVLRLGFLPHHTLQIYSHSLCERTGVEIMMANAADTQKPTWYYSLEPGKTETSRQLVRNRENDEPNEPFRTAVY